MSIDIIFNRDVNINNMDSSVFLVGHTNIANHYDSHSKSNTVLNITSNQNHLHDNHFLLYDHDMIDTSIDDRDVKVSYDFSNSTGSTNINVQDIDINTMSQNSAIFVGEGEITGMDSHTKDNYGMGPMIGHHNLIDHNLNYNEDRDFIDAPIHDSDIKVYNKY